MYKDVAKRILASILIMCMIWSTPDLTMLSVSAAVTSTGNTLEADSDTVFVGETLTINVTNPPNVSGTVVDNNWSSSDTDVATVSNGVVTGMKPGDVTITVSYSANSNIIGDDTIDIHVRKDISKCTVVLDNPTYTGAALTPDVTVTAEDGSTVSADNYDLSWENNQNAWISGYTGAQPSVTLTAKGSEYGGTKTQTFEINPMNLNDLNAIDGAVTYTESVPYQKGSAGIECGLRLAYNGQTLVSGTDYTVDTYPTGDSITMGADDSVEQQVTVNAVSGGNYTGSFPVTYNITKPDISGDGITFVPASIDAQEFTGNKIEPSVSVQQNGVALVKDTDYQVTYGNNTDANTTGTVTVTGIGNYKGTKEFEFDITAISIGESNSDITVESIDTQAFNGSEITPEVTVKYNTTLLIKDTDYTVEYKNNVEAGTASVILTGMGNYGGTRTVTFNITKPISDASIQIGAISSQPYKGSAVEPAVAIRDRYQSGSTYWLTKGTDYDLSYSDNTQAGTATVTITGKGKYTGTTTTTFEIEKGNLDNDSVQIELADPDNCRYTGSDVWPDLLVTCDGIELTKGTDYLCRYVNSKDIGVDSYVVVIGTNNFEGEKEFHYTIEPRKIDNPSVQVSIPDVEALDIVTMEHPDLTITDQGRNDQGEAVAGNSGTYVLKEDEDYELGEMTIDDSGTGHIEIRGLNSYTGTVSKEFTVIQHEIQSNEVTAVLPDEQKSFTYTGAEVIPHPDVTVQLNGVDAGLEKGKDYDITTNAVNVGTYTYTLTFKGIYKGSYTSTTDTFEITKKSISASDVTVDKIPNQPEPAAGSEARPEVTVRFNDTVVDPGNYTCEYSNNTSMGMATVTIIATSDGNFSGSRQENFGIGMDVSAATVSGLADSYVFTSKPICPKVTVTLAGKTLTENVDYELSYENNVNATVHAPGYDSGDAYVVVTGIGDYAGEQKVLMTIARKNMQDSDVTTSVSAVEFTGGSLKPKIEITYKLPDGETYRLISSDEDNQNYDYRAYISGTEVGKLATVEITPAGKNFTSNDGSAYSRSVNIQPRKLTDTDGNLLEYFTVSTPYADNQVKFDETRVPFEPNIVLRDTQRSGSGAPQESNAGNCYQLVRGTDYDITYRNNSTPGEATYTITGKGNYQGTYTGHFEITASLDDAKVEFTDGDPVYTGKEITRSFRVSFGRMTLTRGKDYSVAYQDNINVGTATLLIIGEGSYAGSTLKVPFIIDPKDITGTGVKMSGVLGSYSWTGENIHPSPIFEYNGMTLVSGKDFECTYNDPCYQSTLGGAPYSFTVQGMGNYTGTKTINYHVGDNYNTSRISVELTNGDMFPYTGAVIEPEFKVTLISTGQELELGTEYNYEYVSNTNAGTATLNTWGEGEYAGNVSVTFTILPHDVIEDDVVIGNVPDEDYTGSAIQPTPSVHWNHNGQTELLVNQDFEYVYNNNTNAGTATVTIKGKGNYTNEKSVTFTIRQIDISKSDSGVVIEDVEDQYYTGTEVEPLPKITWKGRTLVKGTDYDITYENNTELGRASFTVEGLGNYTGTVTKQFNIVRVPVSYMDIKYTKAWDYTGNAIEPPLEISYKDSNGKVIKVDSEDSQLTITYRNTIQAGVNTGIIQIKGSNHFEGEATCYYTINARKLTDPTIVMNPDPIPNQVLDGKTGKATPIPTLTFTPDQYTTYSLVDGKDYEISYTNNDAPGKTGTMTIKGSGNFTGTLTRQFYIGDDITQYVDSISFADSVLNYVYNGEAQTPDIRLNMKDASVQLTPNVDYEIVYDGVPKNNITDDTYATKAGTHTVALQGAGKYAGSLELTYEIGKRDISEVEFIVEEQTYTGDAVSPLIIGNDSEAHTRLGETGSTEDVSAPDMWTNVNAFTTSYRGDHTEVGSAVVTITAEENSNYTGTTQVQFNIVAQDIQDKDSIESSTVTDQNYTGSAIAPGIILTDLRRNAQGTSFDEKTDTEYYTLVEGVDYDIVYTDNTYPGTATMTINGKNHYTGTLAKQFNITADLSYAVIAEIPPQKYTGSPVTPELTVTLGNRTLNKNLDYRAEYSDNIERGTATVTIYPVGGSMFTGSKTATFDISRELSAATTTLMMIDASFTYTGSPITPAVAVLFGDTRLQEGVDYTLSYADNVNAGTATITVVGTGAYTGSVGTTFTISRRNIIRCTFGNVADQLYTGKATAQDLLVTDGDRTLVENVDYTVEYINNASPGTATMAISGMGNYSGVKTIRYLVNVKDMTQISASAEGNSIKLSWKKVDAAEGYSIYDSRNKLVAKVTTTSYTHKNLKTMTSYSYKVRPYVVSDGVTYYGGFSNTVSATTGPSKPSIKLSAGTKQVKVSWKKIKGVNGYEVYRSTSRSGKYKKVKTIKKSSTTSYTNKKLKSNKKYYYKVRAYKTVKGKKVYSSYSSVKSTKTK